MIILIHALSTYLARMNSPKHGVVIDIKYASFVFEYWKPFKHVHDNMR